MHDDKPRTSPSMFFMPVVTERTGNIERSYDIFSMLLRSRIIFVQGDIMPDMAALIAAQLLYLEDDDPTKDISMYIQSPGGAITAGMTIMDTMRHVKPDIQTICMGECSSMAAWLLAAGTKGKRMALPHAKVMIHQPLGGFRGQATDIEIHANHILNLKREMHELMAGFTGQTAERVKADTERDNFMSAEDAKAYGIIDTVLAWREAPLAAAIAATAS